MKPDQNKTAQTAGSVPWEGRLLGQTYVAIDCRDGDSMTWPAVTKEITELEWTLRYANDSLTQTQCYVLASLVSAYVQMVNDPADKRNRVCRAIRRAQREGGKE